MFKKKLLLYAILILMGSNSFSQINTKGIPFIKNYTKEDFKASDQNWAVCQDLRGVMYFGNNDDGVLVFNGNTWETISVQNKMVRSLAVDSLGTVYVGGNNDFGYLAPNLNGKLEFVSLSNQVADTINFKEIWKIYTVGTTVYYCSYNYVFIFKDKKYVKTLDEGEGAFWSFLVNNNLYWGNYYKGLEVYKDDTLTVAKGGKYFKEKDIFVILPFNEDHLFIGTMLQGCYLYNTKTGQSQNIIHINKNFERLSKKLTEGQLYNGIVLNDGNFAFATINDGCYIVDKNGKIIEKYAKPEGLIDNGVTSLYQDNYGGLWINTLMGISYVECQAPFKEFKANSGIEGMIMSADVFKGNLYIGTSSGLYIQRFDKNQLPYFELIDEINEFVWITEIIEIENNEKLIIATGQNTYELINPNKIIPINNSNYTNASFIYQSKLKKNRIYIGFEHGYNYIEYKNGKWKAFNKDEDFKGKVFSIAEEENGNLWIGTGFNGLIKIKPDSTRITYDISSGLPSLAENKVYNINNDIVATTNKGLFVYHEESDTFIKYEGFGEKYLMIDDQVITIIQENKNEYWINLKSKLTDQEYIEKVIIHEGRIVNIIDLPFKRLVKNSFSNISPNTESGTWIAAINSVINYNEEKSIESYSNYFNSLINNVIVGIDSVVFGGTYYRDTINSIIETKQPEELKKILDYKNNSIQFFYSSPFFPNNEIKYSHRLDNYEDNWSAWSEEAKSNYTNLNEGHYTFMVKAKNIYGVESEIARYEFSIKPPWYKTIVAYFAYFILAILLIIVIVKVYTRRLELEKIRLEQIVKERTEEVVRQKEEIEKQRDEIADKNQSITDSIEYASRIQKAILPSNEYAEEILPEHFILFRPRDIVSGDFYWMTRKDNLLVVIAADCTGHGVPGAFMSMLGVSFLNEIVNRHEVTSAGSILTQLRADVKKTLGQEGKEGEAKDGMDIALCIVDLEKMKLQYAGAYNPLYLYRNNELLETKADRMPIGIYIKEKESFTNNELELQKGDVFYIFSDGFQDQFGGEDGQKFKTKNFKKLLLDIHQKPMSEQRDILDKTVDEWRGKWEQVDDIIILGVRV